MTNKNKPETEAQQTHATTDGSSRTDNGHASSTSPAEEPIIITDRRSSQRPQDGVHGTEDAQQAKSAGNKKQDQPVDQRVGELEAKLADKEARLEATLGQYKDALDEFNRVKARLTRDVQKEIQAGKKSLLVGLLEVVDNLERALDAAKADPAQAETPLCKGITMVRDQFHSQLSAAGVKKQPALGQPFDPHHFEAISNVPVSDKEQDGRVVGVVRDAYLLGDDTLRHGIVAVGKHEKAS